jgi:hypothetical protein
MSQKRKRSYSVVCRCVVCGRPFRASRTDAKYDTPACRKKASRDRGGHKKNVNPPDASRMSFAHLEYLAEEYGSKYDRAYQSWE